MAAAGAVRKIRSVASTVAVDVLLEQAEDLPECLKYFPNPSNVMKDLHLGVLLGRQVTLVTGIH
jgi:hypothetical protein